MVVFQLNITQLMEIGGRGPVVWDSRATPK